MSVNPATMTVQDVVERVKRQFGDESGVQIIDADIFRWINDGQREIVNKNGILQARSTTDIVAKQGAYAFPMDDILKVISLSYNGKWLQNLSHQEIEQLYRDNSRSAVGEPEYWTVWAGEFTLYPIPEQDISDGLRVDYIKTPADVTTTADVLSLPNKYFNALVHYTLAQAYEQDEDWTAAGNKVAQLEATLNTLIEDDNRPQQEYYETITYIDDEGYW